MYETTTLLVTETISDIEQVDAFCEGLKEKTEEIGGIMNKCEAVPVREYLRNLEEQQPGQVLLEIEFPDEATADVASDEIFVEGKSFGGVPVMSVDNLEKVPQGAEPMESGDIDSGEEMTAEPEEETSAPSEAPTWAPEAWVNPDTEYSDEGEGNGEDAGASEMDQLGGDRDLREGGQNHNSSQNSIRTL